MKVAEKKEVAAKKILVSISVCYRRQAVYWVVTLHFALPLDFPTVLLWGTPPGNTDKEYL